MVTPGECAQAVRLSQSSVSFVSMTTRGRQVLTRAGAACSVFPLLDSKGLAHDVHLSVETVDAPGSAIAAAIGKVAEEVGAALVVLGTNNVLVRVFTLIAKP